MSAAHRTCKDRRGWRTNWSSYATFEKGSKYFLFLQYFKTIPPVIQVKEIHYIITEGHTSFLTLTQTRDLRRVFVPEKYHNLIEVYFWFSEILCLHITSLAIIPVFYFFILLAYFSSGYWIWWWGSVQWEVADISPSSWAESRTLQDSREDWR